jgi:hypothetical protein
MFPARRGYSRRLKGNSTSKNKVVTQATTRNVRRARGVVSATFSVLSATLELDISPLLSDGSK